MYEVIRPIAAGHQGQVDLARAPDGSLVALKRLAVDGTLAERDVARRRIRREAELLRGVQIDGVIPLLDVIDELSDTGDPELVLVMPYLPGGSLHDRVSASGPLPAERLSELAVPLLGALAALHRRGIVHRDVKPSNVLFDAVEGRRPCLIDFGIGIARDFTAGLSSAAAMLGTPSFIAPERARGEAATPASDIYSLGATLRFAITGMPPHGVGDIVSVVGRAAAGRVEPLPPGTDPRVVEVLDHMCALDPADRPTAAELLPGPEGSAVRGLPAPAAQVADAAPVTRRRNRALTTIGAAALLVVGIATGVVAATQLGGDGEPGTTAAADTLDPAP
ncbi:MAG: serine/threonine protein kinase, partial [Acidimicrobiia bacterium]|nr:serine/threonine protein kinase [Acidimicrobiia bacterium]